MKYFLLIFILLLSSQSLAKSQDIKDFEIEGMSIGDSALDFFTKKEINEATVQRYDDDTFFDKEFYHESFSTYEGVQIAFKKNDEQFIIYSVSGINFYKDNADECFKKVDEVANEISSIFKNVEGQTVNKSHEGDPTGKSKVKSIDYWLETGIISVECWDWSEEITRNKGWTDNFGVSIFSNEHVEWLNSKAYN